MGSAQGFRFSGILGERKSRKWETSPGAKFSKMRAGEMTKEQARRKEYFKKLDLLTDEGIERVYEEIDFFYSTDHYRKDKKSEQAQIVNFEK